jgi:iron complex outermembrane recepter protein
MNPNINGRARAPRVAAPCARPNLIIAAALVVCATAAHSQQITLEPMVIKGKRVATPSPADAALDREGIKAGRARSNDTAHLLGELPGVSLYGAGGVSSLPSVHGLGDDRLRIQVDGMDLVSSCGNHMNPPLSYIEPTRVNTVNLFAGIVPVSMGGDSIGAVIQVESAPPEFAEPGQSPVAYGEAGAFYRSNGNGRAANASATLAGAEWALRYDGAVSASDNYHAASDFKAAVPAAIDKPTRLLEGDEVGSSSYLARNHAVTIATRRDQHLFEVKVGLQDIPFQNFPNQRMDMTGNDGTQVNLRYQGTYDWGKVQLRAYSEKTRHSMNFGEDKQFRYGPALNVPGMPMETEGRTLGLQAKAEMPLSPRDTMRVGVEAQRYNLDDWWPPSGGGMAPDMFWNIRDGQRNRLDAFGEWESRWSPQWLSIVGLRSANVTSNTGNVQGYNAGYATDANAFNSRDHKRTDHNIDLAALARYTPNPTATYEFGYAHKTRSPNLYERYTWSKNGMAMLMVNFAGDGNGYVGDLDLRPETADTLSATADWHDAARESWQVKFTPYVTYVHDYIDAKRCTGGSGMMAVCTPANQTATQRFVYLSFTNNEALLRGFDLSGFSELARTSDWGTFSAVGQLGYVRGTNRTTGDNLYNIMPLNARLALVQRLGGWTATAETVLVSAKTQISQVRNELKTAGFGLVNLRASYEWTQVRLDFGIENLFDRFHNHPLGGAYVGQGRTMSGTGVPWGVAVPGMGRSINLGMTVKF